MKESNLTTSWLGRGGPGLRNAQGATAKVPADTLNVDPRELEPRRRAMTTTPAIDPYVGDFFSKRGIDPDIARERPYVRWTREDIAPVRKAYTRLNKNQRAYMSRLARQSGGWIITRHTVPGAPKIYAEIRPDNRVETGPPVRHWHGSGEPSEDAYEPGVSVLERGSEAWRDHCRKANEANAENGIEAEDHRLVENVHEHPDAAKYVFPPSPKRDKPWVHDHHAGRSGEYYEKYPEALERHTKDWHAMHPKAAEPLASVGMHKHTRRVKNHDNNLARRIDIHPLAWPLLRGAEVVYFGIEGCLKADSILSAILREGQKASVFSVPSVSLWHAKELEKFAGQYLRGKTVIIVPDSDWVNNDKVIAQARLAEYFLREDCGVRAYVAAPPLNPDRTVNHKGVDDFLGAGGKLAEMTVMERTLSPNLAIVERQARYEKRHRKDRVANDVQAVKALAHQSTIQENGEGLVQTTLKTLGNVLGVNRQTAFNIVGRIERDGWVRVEGEWAAQKGYHTKDGYFPSALEFKKSKIGGKKNPRILVHEGLCGEDREWPLGELLPESLDEPKRKVA